MASFAGSFRLGGNFPPARALRPTLSRRAHSGSSESSCNNSSASEDQFVFSVGNTPSHEYPASSEATSLEPGVTSAPRDGLLFGKKVAATTSDSSVSFRPTQSKPIAIELPTARKINYTSESAPADTPPEPLSARGDIPGGYFPLHEDPLSRVRRPHPFHLDASKAKHRSLNRAAESTKTTSNLSTVPEPSHFPFTASTVPAMSESHAPVSSYIPIGVHDTAAPLGKYYPSNYERRPTSNHHQHLKPPARAGASASAKESQASKHQSEFAHSRTTSEVKRRLLQYQRDMVAQATIAASALLANSSASGGELGASEYGSNTIGGVAVPDNIQQGRALIKTHKPLSPRLAPLGSPGPVTPMSLESGGDGYMAIGHNINPLDPQEQLGAVRVEEHRRHLEGTGPPVAGPPISV